MGGTKGDVGDVGGRRVGRMCVCVCVCVCVGGGGGGGGGYVVGEFYSIFFSSRPGWFSEHSHHTKKNVFGPNF